MSYEKFIADFKEAHPNRKLLFVCKAGSHFFNLQGPNSDTDYKGIYLPSPEEFSKGESRRRFFERTTGKDDSKNGTEDVDMYLFSYTNFLDLLGRGDFNCMELLFCEDKNIIQTSPEFQELVSIRESLLVNNISAFLGFIKKEYRRYGVNINHYKELSLFAKKLREYEPHTRLIDIWEDLKEYAKGNDYIVFTKSSTGNNHMIPAIKIAQRLFHNSVTVDYVYNGIEDRLKRYGHRQKNMAESGVEFKGLYHALRLIYEATDLITLGTFKLPFNNKRWSTLKVIKEGKCNQDYIFNLIDTEIENLQKLEKTAISNKDNVLHLVEKLKFIMKGKMELLYIHKKVIDK